MMLGNLLGHIDALLSDDMEGAIGAANISYKVKALDEQENDKRKGIIAFINTLVTFSEAVMEKTISARTSTTVSCVGTRLNNEDIDLSNEISKNIDSYICDLDNEISMTNDQSYLGESLELSKADIVVAGIEHDTINDHGTNSQRNTTKRVNENNVLEDEDNASEDSLIFDAGVVSERITPIDHLGLMDENLPTQVVDNDPFLEKTQSLEQEFVINSPFSKHSKDLAAQEHIKDVSQTIFGDVQEPKSATIDDFKELKTEMDSVLHESSNLPVLDLLNEEFHSADDLSDIFSQSSKEEGLVTKEEGGIQSSFAVIDIPTTPRSAPPVEQFMSPGQFFSQKSGKLGYLGDSKAGTERPLWYTPKTDAAGCVLDPIEATPTESNKLLQTPRGSRLVRQPLYSSPSSRMHQESANKALTTNIDTDPGISESKLIIDDKLRHLVAEYQDSNSISKVSHNTSAENETKRIQILFPAVNYRSESRISISIDNPTCKDAFWTVKPVGYASVVNEGQHKHSVDDIIFRFIQNKGKVISASDIILSISFFPLIAGLYTQIFHLRVQSYLIILELSGESLRPQYERQNPRPRCSLPQSQQHALISSQTPHQVTSGMRLVQTDPPKRILSERKSCRNLDFGSVRLHDNISFTIHVCNNRAMISSFKMYLSGPFAIPTEKLCIDSKSYVALPIAFIPTQTGTFKGFLVIKSDTGKSEKIVLTGMCKK